MYQSFEDLGVWKKATQLTVRLYKELDKCRDYGLKDQMLRAAVSIPSNIAEGAERDSNKEYAHFLNIAKGSAAELRTQVYIASEVGVLDKPTSNDLTTELVTISKMLHGLIKSLKPKP